jgi:hypothetical protein
MLQASPHPALRATFSRKREKGFSAPTRALFPLAGEGWDEGTRDSTIRLVLALPRAPD